MIDAPFPIIKAVSQIRTAGEGFAKVTVKGVTHCWNQTQICICCNLNAKESMQHLLIDCPANNRYRVNLRNGNGTSRDAQYTGLLTDLSKEKLLEIYFAIGGILRARSFALNL